MIISSVLNYKKNVWGGIISAVMLVKAVGYGSVLISGTLSLMSKGENDPLLAIWIFIAAGGLIGLFLLLKNLRVDEQSRVFA
jgi:hypothetical protein